MATSEAWRVPAIIKLSQLETAQSEFNGTIRRINESINEANIRKAGLLHTASEYHWAEMNRAGSTGGKLEAAKHEIAEIEQVIAFKRGQYQKLMANPPAGVFMYARCKQVLNALGVAE